jgi:branched-subunit amino acid transport protein
MKFEPGVALFGVVVASILMPGAFALIQWLGMVDPRAGVFTYALWLYVASVTISVIGAYGFLALCKWLSLVTISRA